MALESHLVIKSGSSNQSQSCKKIEGRDSLPEKHLTLTLRIFQKNKRASSFICLLLVSSLKSLYLPINMIVINS